MKFRYTALTLALTFLQLPLLSQHSQAATNSSGENKWLVRGRLVAVLPDETGSANINGRVSVDDSIVPEIDFTYFWTKNIATEVMLTTTPQKMTLIGSSRGDLDLGSVWITTPTVTMQYHFNPEGMFSPYVGAGMGYALFNDSSTGTQSSVIFENRGLYALQMGIDYALNNRWVINADVKKMYLETSIDIDTGAATAATAKLQLDPWIIGVGAGYRF